MFALPAVPQDLAFEPRSDRTVEVRTALEPAVERVVLASTPEEYEATLEELVETAELPPVPVDMNQVLAAFGKASGLFYQAMGEFALMRDTVPYGDAATLRQAIDDVHASVFSGTASLEWSRIIVAFIESSVALAALYTALHHGVKPTAFFTHTLALRALESHREMRRYLEAEARGTASSEVPNDTQSKVEVWMSKAAATGIHRPFGDHVE